MPFHCSLLASGMTDFSDPVNRNIVYVVDSKPKNSQLSQGPLDTLRQESGDPHVCQLHSKKSALWPPVGSLVGVIIRHINSPSQKLMQGFAGLRVRQKRSAGARPREMFGVRVRGASSQAPGLHLMPLGELPVST